MTETFTTGTGVRLTNVHIAGPHVGARAMTEKNTGVGLLVYLYRTADEGHSFRVINDELVCRLCNLRWPNNASGGYGDCPVTAELLPEGAGLPELQRWARTVADSRKSE